MASIFPATEATEVTVVARGHLSVVPAAEGAPVIEARGVVKQYGSLRAVDGVDLQVRPGEIFGLIGHNGAGKSTLFKLMLGLIAPSSGQLQVCGTAVNSSAFRNTRRLLGYLPENVVLYDNLNGLETLEFFARLKGAEQAQCAAVLEQVGLAHALGRPVREYSKGMRQRLGFAQALLGNPRVLFLDEPTNGLDPQAIRDFYAMLRNLRDAGVAVVITSHILAELQERVDRLAIMAQGKIMAQGSVASLREQMHMPLQIEVRLQAEAIAPLQAALGHLPGLHCQALPLGLRLTCPRAAKMSVLGIIHQAGPGLLDLSVQEPSLEDVFFGFSD